jgi:hypothetical protein
MDVQRAVRGVTMLFDTYVESVWSFVRLQGLGDDTAVLATA